MLSWEPLGISRDTPCGRTTQIWVFYRWPIFLPCSFHPEYSLLPLSSPSHSHSAQHFDRKPPATLLLTWQLHHHISTEHKKDVEKRRNEVALVLVEDVQGKPEDEKQDDFNIGDFLQLPKRVALTMLPILLPLLVAPHIDLLQHVVDGYVLRTTQADLPLKTCSI